MSAALVVVAVPASMVGLTPAMQPVAKTMPAVVRASAQVSLAPIAPSVTSLQRHYLSHVPPGLRPQVVAEQVTIAAGLSLRTKADRNRKISVTSSKGSRVWTASALAEHDLPSAAMRAYKNAARSVDATDPGCHLPWTLLAGIGRVESDHGRYGGSVLGNDGVPRPAIIGVALDGKGPVAAIRDTDHGAFDGDTVWDRAVGPMQFIPSTWQGAGRDGDHDGTRSPNDIDDASLAAAAYLCGGGGSLADESAEKAAVFRYNPSDYYVALVTAFARGYRTGVFVIPSPDLAPVAGDGVAKVSSARAAKARAKALARARAAGAARRLARARAAQLARARSAARSTAKAPVRAAVRPKPGSTAPSPTSTAPKPPTTSPTPTPTSTPTPPKLVLSAVTGVFDGGGSDWTLDGKPLDLGQGRMGDPAARDYDGQNGVQSIGQELLGLVGRTVTLQVKDGTWVVYVIAGEDYRGADGSFTS